MDFFDGKSAGNFDMSHQISKCPEIFGWNQCIKTIKTRVETQFSMNGYNTSIIIWHSGKILKTYCKQSGLCQNTETWYQPVLDTPCIQLVRLMYCHLWQKNSEALNCHPVGSPDSNINHVCDPFQHAVEAKTCHHNCEIQLPTGRGAARRFIISQTL
jgi:hypothetical protein